MIAFVDSVRDALTELDLEMRRVLEWLEHDRPRYWKLQTRQAADQVNVAQAALHRCLMYPIADERPACTDERVALKRAKARLEYCESKQERVREWARTVRHELFEYEGRISQLVRVAEIDAPEAIGLLTRILRRLEEYQAASSILGQNAYDDRALAAELWPEAGVSASGGEEDASKPENENGPDADAEADEKGRAAPAATARTEDGEPGKQVD